MEFFLTVVVGGLVVAVGGAVVSYRSSTRSRWWLSGGALFVVAGIVAAYWGFGYAWMAWMDERSQTPGVIAFFTGLGGTFAGIGMLAGRAARAVRASAARPDEAIARPTATRNLVMGALACFLTSQACLVLYLNGYLEGNAGVFSALCISLTLVAAWILGALALKAAGHRGAVFLLVAPWPILAVDLITFAFYESPGVYVISGVTVVLIAGLALRLVPPRSRPHDRRPRKEESCSNEPSAEPLEERSPA